VRRKVDGSIKLGACVFPKLAKPVTEKAAEQSAADAVRT